LGYKFITLRVSASEIKHFFKGDVLLTSGRSPHFNAPACSIQKLVSGENKKSSALISVLISGAIVPLQGASIEALLVHFEVTSAR
jgi:hypothetical protein